MELLNTVKTFFLTHGVKKNYLLGLSGGLDSCVLLHLLTQLRAEQSFKLRAVYVNHGVNPHAASWASHCEKMCNEHEVDFILRNLQHSNVSEGGGREDFLRRARYQIFSDLMTENDVLVTAHHQNDQAETVLLQLFRGAGPKGLAAMPSIKPFAEGLHARPLLAFTREELRMYAEKNQLQWIEDDSNSDVSYARNFLRHEVLPLLEKRWPSISHTLSRVANHCAETQDLLEDVLQTQLARVAGTMSGTLSVSQLLTLSLAERRQFIRLWLAQKNFPLPSAAKLQEIVTIILTAGQDRTPHISWGGVELRRYRDNLFVMPALLPHDNQQVFQWDFSESLEMKHLGFLTAIKKQGQGLKPSIQSAEVRFRQGGEMIRIAGRTCTHDLKKWFQSQGVPSWLRDRIPLIYVDNKLAAIANDVVSEEFAAKSHEKGWVIEMRA